MFESELINTLKINLIKEPFPHIILENVFNERELTEIWNELIFLAPKMRPPEADLTGTAKNNRNIPLKRGHGLMIDNFFSNPQDSDIMLHFKKIMSTDIGTNAKQLGMYFDLFRKIRHGTTLVQMYRNGDYYLPHDDYAIFSAVTLFYKSPKAFVGGDLNFPEHNYIPSLKNNTTIIFPSMINHEVTELSSSSNKIEDARFTVTLLLAV